MFSAGIMRARAAGAAPAGFFGRTIASALAGRTARRMHAREIARANPQQGAALIIALVLLAVIAFIGFAAMETSLLQSRMAAAQKLQEATFQAAESAIASALEDAEGLIRAAGENGGGVGAEDGTEWRDYRKDAAVFPGDERLRADAQIRFIGHANLPGYSLRRGASGINAYFYELRVTAWREGERPASIHAQGFYVEGPMP